MARAKHTGRAEARRKYRQAMSQDPADEGLDEELPPEPQSLRGSRTASSSGPAPARSPAPPAVPARPGIGYAFRTAYHPANVREDLAALPRLLRHWSFWVPSLAILVGAVVSTIWWNFTGGQLIFQLLVFPGSGFGLPQLMAGFFAPRASYLLGFIVSIIQGIAATIFAVNLANSLGTPLGSDQTTSLVTQAFLAGPLSGMLFAAAAAWYRRFLALSSPRRAAEAARRQQQQARSSSKPKASRR